MSRSSIPILFLVTLVAVSCSVNPNASEDKLVLAQPTPDQQQPCKSRTKHIEFENVSFDYDLCAFGDLKAEKIRDFPLEQPDMKPDEVAPEHVHFKFELGPQGWEPTIDVYPVQRFPLMYAVDKQQVKGIEQEIKDLKKAINDPTYRVSGQIPYIPFIDASQSFQSHVKASQFSGGKGIYFITYLDTELTLIENDHLRYIFEGITSDGKFYILAEIPVFSSYLANAVQHDDDHFSLEGLSYDELIEMVSTETNGRRDQKYQELKRKYDRYLSSVTNHIEESNPNEFKPSLTKLEDLIATLKIVN